jgi:hypothetical protein
MLIPSAARVDVVTFCSLLQKDPRRGEAVAAGGRTRRKCKSSQMMLEVRIVKVKIVKVRTVKVVGAVDLTSVILTSVILTRVILTL